ncbi:hypothetical protein J2P12_00745 [Candidatus Bathyarchaeota archaeon]|nr:hypothetical protein [Candidatus Bathyarchaeota archaeon]
MQTDSQSPITPGFHGRGLELFADQPFYLPGQKVKGRLQANLEHDTSVGSLSLSLQGIESTHFTVQEGKNKYTYESKRDLLNVGVQLLPKSTIQAGSTPFPFSFDLPTDALPSHTGRTASVTWKLSATADVPWGGNIKSELYLLVYTVAQGVQAVPVISENQEHAPRIRLSLSSNLYQPGEAIEGRLALLAPGNLRSVTLQLMLEETAFGKGTWTGKTSGSRTTPVMVGSSVRYSIQDLSSGEIPFHLPLSTNTACTYSGTNSSIRWYVYATLDVPHSVDLHLAAPFVVGLKQA